MSDIEANSVKQASIFGLQVSTMTEHDIATHLASTVRNGDAGPGLIVTPNIQHVAVLRHDPEFRDAYEFAEIITCDGFPVYFYARARGCRPPARVTGRGIVTMMMDHPALLADHRMFFVLADKVTADAVSEWARLHGLNDNVSIVVPPFGFDRDPVQCLTLANKINRFRATILFMGLGAPKSEIFVYRYRGDLPACWSLCVGQAVKVAMGLMPDPPALIVAFHSEWLWRIILEPRRLTRRYIVSTWGFMLAVLDDLRQKRPHRRAVVAGEEKVPLRHV